MVDIKLAKASVPGTSPGIIPGAGVVEVVVVLLELVEAVVVEEEEGVVVAVVVEVVDWPGVGMPGGRLKPIMLKSPGEVSLSCSKAFWI